MRESRGWRKTRKEKEDKRKKEENILDFPKVALSRRAQLHGQVTWLATSIEQISQFLTPKRE